MCEFLERWRERETETQNEKRNFFASSRKLSRVSDGEIREEYIFLGATDGYEEEWMKIRIVNISSFSTKLGGVVVEREKKKREFYYLCNSIIYRISV